MAAADRGVDDGAGGLRVSRGRRKEEDIFIEYRTYEHDRSILLASPQLFRLMSGWLS